jgi:hypothetical protein
MNMISETREVNDAELENVSGGTDSAAKPVSHLYKNGGIYGYDFSQKGGVRQIQQN